MNPLVAPRMHVAAGCLLLLLVSFVAGGRGYFFIDESAMLGQVDLVREGTWTARLPIPAEDGVVAEPMAKSTYVDGSFAPFPKHPLHVAVLVAVDTIAGVQGMRLLSTAAALVAGVLAMHLVPASRPGVRITAFWVVVVASPLLFDSQLIVAHALAAPVAGAIAVVLARERSLAFVPLLAGLVALGVLLRTEFLLVAGAFSLVWGARAVVRRSGRSLLDSVVISLAAVLSYSVEGLVIDALIGEDQTSAVEAGVGRLSLSSMASGARIALLGFGAASPLSAVAVGSTLVGVIAVVVAVRRDPPSRLLLGAAGVGAAVGGFAFALQPAILPGLLPAFPAVVLLTAAWQKDEDPPPVSAALPGAVAGILGAGVIVTQYGDAGGFEWGWRYMAVAIPLVAPLAAYGFVNGVTRARTVHSGPALGLVAVGVLMVSVGGLRELVRNIDDTAEFLSRSESAAGETCTDLLLYTDPSFGRFVHHLAITGHTAALNPETRKIVENFLTQNPGVTAGIVWRGGEPPDESLAGRVPVGDPLPLGGGYAMRPLAPPGGERGNRCSPDGG